MQTFQSELRRNSADHEARTVQVIWTTGAAVRRHRLDGYEVVPFDEVLEVNERSVDLTRLNMGAPVLLDHQRSIENQVAVVERAWIQGGQGFAVLRFPTKGIDPRADAVFSKIADNIIRNLSVGYAVLDAREEPATGATDVERFIVTRWSPYELTLTPVGADAGAQVRSGGKAHSNAARRMRLRQAALQAR